MSTRPSRLTVAALALATLAACAPAVSTSSPAVDAGPTTLLTRLGTDTLSVEQYTRTASGITGVIALREPMAMLVRYDVRIGAGNAPTSADFSYTRGDGSPGPGTATSITMRFGADSTTITAHRPAGDTSRTVASRGMLLPASNGSYGLYELALARLLAAGRDSATFESIPLGFGIRGTTATAIRLVGRDSARIDYFGDPIRVHHDGRGNLLSLDGTRTTNKVRVDRVAGTDVVALARAWSARQATAGAPGMVPSRDTARATVGRAHVWVDYGRPLLRGRDVWVNGVLGDTLWRTGSNAATQLSTDVDLMIGGQHVPAGTYSLFTWAGRNGYHLVINRQAGQWGTEYDPARDLARVPLRETNGAESTERFTISLEPQGASAATLVLAWGTKRLSVPVSSM